MVDTDDKNIFIPWVEKYRPQNIDEIISQNEIVKSLSSAIKKKNLPHLLFHGPPGVGKTTTAIALCNNLFNNDISNRVLELNASDDRGIETVRKKIKTFASLSIGNLDYKNDIPPFKIIILDEVDNMTQDAQAALRRIMESFSKITRFILICNYITNVIDPINSRCVKFRFKYMDSNNINNHLEKIASLENYNIDQNTIKDINKLSNGDMRTSIMLLQTGINLHGSNLNSEDIYDIAGYIPNKMIKELYLQCKRKDFNKASEIVKTIISNGFTGYQLLQQISSYLDLKNIVNQKNYHKIRMTISKADFRITSGSNQYIQILEVIGCIINNIN